MLSFMSERWSLAKMPDLAKRTLQTGSRALHLNPRLRSRHPQRSQRRRNNPDTMEVDEICISEAPNGLAVSIGRIDKKVETKTGDFVTLQAAGEWGMGAHTGGRFAPTRDEISKLAYSLYESRGRQDGRDTEDWLRAEQQLLHQYAQPPMKS